MDNECAKVLTDDELESVSGGLDVDTLVCPHCGSSEITPYHSPSRGTLYLCSNCYRSFSKKDLK